MNRFINLYQKWSALRSIRSELNALSDLQLEDLGMCRADIPR